jgi:nicotinamidase-related amidase
MSPHVAGTTPYPWPYDGDLTGGGTALLVVAPAGATAQDDLLPRIVGLLAAAVHGVGGLVVAATTAPPARVAAPPGIGGRGGALGLLRAGAADELVVARGIDAFFGSDLDLILRTRGVDRLVLAGLGLETCVHSTMRDANDRGYECLLVVDACEPVDPALVQAAVSMIEKSGGIFGAVGRSADVLAALTPEGALT